jgi:hypothetical protein
MSVEIRKGEKKMKSQLTETANTKSSYISLGYNDNKGRTLGIRIKTFDVTFTQLDDKAMVWHNIEAGHYFALNTMVTKNGSTFGPTQNDKYFRTADLREAAIKIYIAASIRKAASK